MRVFTLVLHLFCFTLTSYGQNLVVDGSISNNANWNGQESPFNSGVFENTYIAGGCGGNYVMEADLASSPQQVVNGFVSGAIYTIYFRYAWRTTSCSASSSPTTLNIQFTDAPAVLNTNLAVPNTQTVFTGYSFTFVNNAATSHTLLFTNPGNTNTCGVILDDITIKRISTPGGVTAPTLWFNAGTINQVNNTGLYGWISTGSIVQSVAPNCPAPPQYFTGLASPANGLVASYNPYITFNGSSQYLEYTTQRLDAMNLLFNGSFFAVHYGGAAGRTYFGHRNNTSTFGMSRGSTSGYIMANSTGAGSNAPYTANARVNLVSMNGNNSGIVTRDLNGTGLTVAAGTTDADYLTLGVRRNAAGVYSEYYNGALSEIIAINATLTASQMQQVRSYLAAKYGVTLADNTGTVLVDERYYLTTDGLTVYWNYLLNSAFHNNITVVGRDDNTSLDHRRAISTGTDNTTTGNAMLIMESPTALTADRSYIAAGHNGIASNLANYVDVPAGIASRLQRVWKYQKTGTGVPGSITVSFDMTGYTPLTGSDLRLLVSTSTGFVGSTVITGTYAAPYFTASLPTTGGVFFTVGSVNMTTPLPIELLDFNAVLNGKQVDLSWATASEAGNDYFTVERSPDGTSWHDILTVDGAGYSSGTLYYTDVDRAPLRGISYYRLRQTDFSGHADYSATRVVEINGEPGIQVFPNPGNGDALTLEFTGFDNEAVRVTVRDIQGKLYHTGNYSITPGTVQVSIPMLPKPAAGTYVVEAQWQNNAVFRKIVVK